MRFEILLGITAVFLSACDREDKRPFSPSVFPVSIVSEEPPAPPPKTQTAQEPVESPKPTHAYILAGQSNMSRQCGGSDQRYTAPPGCSTGEALGKLFTEPNALFVQCAVGGTEMSRWIVGGDLYGRCVGSVPNGIPVKGIFFFQGESDAINGLSVPDWSDAFATMVSGFRGRFGSTLPVVFAQIGSGRSDQNWIAIQQEQESVSLPYCSMVKTSDIPPDDGVHFTQESYYEIAQRMKREFDALGGAKP